MLCQNYKYAHFKVREDSRRRHDAAAHGRACLEYYPLRMGEDLGTLGTGVRRRGDKKLGQNDVEEFVYGQEYKKAGVRRSFMGYHRRCKPLL